MGKLVRYIDRLRERNKNLLAASQEGIQFILNLIETDTAFNMTI